MRDAFILESRFEGLYRVTARPLLALVHNTNYLSELWHRKLAHIHYDALLKFKKLVSGIPDVQAHHDGVCPSCASGKKTRGPFPSSKNKTNDILHLIHFDICGPMLVHSIGGDLYYTFIDNFSRKTWISTRIENQSGKRIKVFKSDNGGEYMSNKFIAFCKKEGIKKETIVPYTPKHNGLAERKNKSIVEAARAMLHDQNVPKFLGAEATFAAVYVQNRVPHQAL